MDLYAQLTKYSDSVEGEYEVSEDLEYSGQLLMLDALAGLNVHYK